MTRVLKSRNSVTAADVTTRGLLTSCYSAGCFPCRESHPCTASTPQDHLSCAVHRHHRGRIPEATQPSVAFRTRKSSASTSREIWIAAPRDPSRMHQQDRPQNRAGVGRGGAGTRRARRPWAAEADRCRDHPAVHRRRLRKGAGQAGGLQPQHPLRPAPSPRRQDPHPDRARGGNQGDGSGADRQSEGLSQSRSRVQ
jgi:hypothetical protein